MKTIKLYGAMGKQFGREFKLDVQTPAEALRALSMQIKGFHQYLYDHAKAPFKVITDKEGIEADALLFPCQKTIKIIPVISGSGGNGIGSILLGGALLAAVAFLPALAAISVIGTATVGSVATGLAFSLILGGVSQLLATSPQGNQAQGTNKPSYAFNGAVNTTGQGNPVPIGYGRMVVGSSVISAGLYSEQI